MLRVRTSAISVVVASVAAMALASGALAGGGKAPRREHGHGHWFERVCSGPGAQAASCNAEVVSDSSGTPLASGSPPAGAFGPAQFQGGYHLPADAPSTQTIAIVDAYDDPKIEQDLATFSSYYGLPACTSANGCFRKVDQNGGTRYPKADSGWAIEISLDVEVAHEICQNCKILLVEARSASFSDLGAAENRAVALGADVVSNSWGAGEFSGETSLDSYFNHPGVVITASSGDSGYGAEYPAASPYVTAVGGTTLSLNLDNSYKSESVWSGTGSGCSSQEAKPAWQSDSGCPRRTVVDVAADADPNSGAAVYDSVSYSGQSGWFQVGGTSLSSPLIAAVYALTGTASQVVYGSAPYGNPGGLHDVKSGSNGTCSPSYLCHAQAGYDGPTGLGTPNGLSAFTAGPPPAPDFSLSASPSTGSVVQGESTTFTVALSSLNGYSKAVALSVSGLPAGATASFNPTWLSSNASSTLTVQTGSSTPTGPATLTVKGTDGSITHTTTVTLEVTAPAAGDFSLAVSPSRQNLKAPGSASYTVTITALKGFTGSVALSLSGLPGTFSAVFSPNPATTSSVLTISVPRTRKSNYTFTVTGTSEGLTHSAGASLQVR